MYCYIVHSVSIHTLLDRLLFRHPIPRHYLLCTGISSIHRSKRSNVITIDHLSQSPDPRGASERLVLITGMPLNILPISHTLRLLS